MRLLGVLGDAERDAAQAGRRGTLSERIAPGTKAVSLRIHGSKGAPKVIVRGPDGTTITSPVKQRGKQRKGRYLLAENKKDRTTSVLLVKPAAGTWTVKAAPGAKSRPTRIDRSNFERPAALFGQVRWTAPYRREVAFAYAVPGARRSAWSSASKKGIGRTLVKSVRGKPCRGARRLPGGRKLLCVRKKFRVARGPGGDRTIQAIVTRGGIPLARRNVAKFRAPRQPRAGAAGRPDARAGWAAALVVVFPRSRGASRYNVTAVLWGRASPGLRPGRELPRGEDPEGGGRRRSRGEGRGRALRREAGALPPRQLAGGRNTAGPARRLPKKICR